MKTLLTRLFRGSIQEQEIYDESIERLADALMANYEARERARERRDRMEAA